MRRVAALRSICLACVFCGPAIAVETCRDIASVDFRNRAIWAAPDHWKSEYGSEFNGPAPGGPLRLRNGVFREWDRVNNVVDWETTIEKDILLHPAGSNGVRILVLGRDHRSGTGSFTYIFGFQCSSSTVKKIFEASGEGVKFGRATDKGIEITVGIWSKDDPHAGPSTEVQLRYLWSPALKRFVREPSKATIPWLP